MSTYTFVRSHPIANMCVALCLVGGAAEFAADAAVAIARAGIDQRGAARRQHSPRLAARFGASRGYKSCRSVLKNGRLCVCVCGGRICAATPFVCGGATKRNLSSRRTLAQKIYANIHHGVRTQAYIVD